MITCVSEHINHSRHVKNKISNVNVHLRDAQLFFIPSNFTAVTKLITNQLMEQKSIINARENSHRNKCNGITDNEFLPLHK